jgi:hypothetical protein
MNLVVEMRFGAHLYGTETADSDLDLKAVFLPSAADILLQRVKPAVYRTRPKAPAERNTAQDVDFEAYSLQRYMELLAEGQTVAIDMLFAPDSALTAAPSPIWREIQANAGRFISTRAPAFVRYCRQQANRFGIKGSRVAAARHVLAFLNAMENRLGASCKLSEVEAGLGEIAVIVDHVAMPALPGPNGQAVLHLEVCDKKVPLTASIKTAREILQRLVDEYGHRALQAERNEGVDWKALSHAVRVGREALELFETGRIVFPLVCAAHLRLIKRGALSYGEVASEIESLLDQVESAAQRSNLPAVPDTAAMDDIVLRAYRACVAMETVE